MHEVAAMHDVVISALEAMRAEGGSRVTAVQVVLGASGHLTEDAARLHFELQAAGTPVEGAQLEFTWLPATYQCFMCLRRFESILPAESITCPECGGVAVEIAHDDTISIRSITIEMAELSAEAVPQTATSDRSAGEEQCASASPDE